MIVKTYEQTKECTVQMSRKLAALCEPYKGCPRGPIGTIGSKEGTTEEETIRDILLSNGNYVLKGTEEDFICIPREDYERLLQFFE